MKFIKIYDDENNTILIHIEHIESIKESGRYTLITTIKNKYSTFASVDDVEKKIKAIAINGENQ